MGNHSYLQLAPQPVTDGHVQIIPTEHCWSMTAAGEEVAAEVSFVSVFFLPLRA